MNLLIYCLLLRDEDGENDLCRCLIRVILREKISKAQVFSSYIH